MVDSALPVAATSFDITPLLADHAISISVVTPNRRLAASLKRSFDQAKRAAGCLAWASPDILPIATFIERTWRSFGLPDDGKAPPQLIDATQSLLLWEQVVAKSDASAALLSVPQTARQAAAAWALVHRWQLPTAMRSVPLHDDGQTFLAWAMRYQQLLRERNLLDGAMLPDALTALLTGDASVLPKRLYTAGFDIVTPQLQHFLDACVARQVLVQPLPVTDAPPQAATVRKQFATDLAEIRACATWARERLEVNRAARIAVVVPDLRAKRGQVVRALTDALLPMARATMAADEETVATLFNVSLGVPLSDYGLVHDALLLIEFSSQRPMPTLSFSALLRTPFIAGADSEMTQRASLDALLRERLSSQISLFGLQKKFKLSSDANLTRATAACEKFCAVIDKVASQADDRVSAKTQSGARAIKSAPADWRRHFTSTLAAWGFPGERTLSSTDFQVLTKFREALAGLATLQLVQPQMRADEALVQLRRIVADTVFQPESANAGEAPLQVLGILESVGQTFDALWVSGLHDEAWPLAARPNPFVPIGLQRRAGVTEATPAASLALDQRITEGWRKAATEVVFSHALSAGAGRGGEPGRAASALIRSWPLVDANDYGRNYAEALQAMATLAPREPIPDTDLVSLPIATTVSGGASIIRDQAACPFRGFARHRLGARPLAIPETGLDAAARGTLLHRVLCLVWTQLNTQALLLSMDLQAINELVQGCVQQSIAEAQRDGLEVLSGRFAVIESARLTRVVGQWLAYERGRAPFEVVGCEQARTITLSGLSMRVRLDRMDRLDDGTHALIDYKTGVAKVASWLGERPDEPQLPLYFYSAEQPIAALAFARLKRGKTFGFAGVSATDDLLPEVVQIEKMRGMDAQGYTSWDVLVQSWENALVRLADQFTDGIAAVDPKNGGPTCAQCDLQSLCRIAEYSALVGSDAEVDERVGVKAHLE